MTCVDATPRYSAALPANTGTGRIRVVQILHTLERAGIETLVTRFARDQSAHIDTTVVCLDSLGPLADELRLAQIPVYCTERRPGIDWRQVPAIARILRDTSPHIVHCHQYSPFFYGVFAARLAGVGRVVYTAHGRDYPDVVSLKRRLVNKLLFRYADSITAVCDYTRRQLRKREGLRRFDIDLIYNGIDVQQMRACTPASQVRRNLYIAPDATVIVHVGTFRQIKDQALAIRAFRRLVNNHPSCVLVFVGEGELLDACRELAWKLCINDHVRFLGRRADVPDILNASDIMLMTSRCEAHSVALLEAMACALPIVTTAAGGNAETVVHGQTGLLTRHQPSDIASALQALVDDVSLRRRMGREGYARVCRLFTRERMHNTYLSLYRTVMEHQK